MKSPIGLILVFVVVSYWPAQSQVERSVWDGVYTDGQAARGEAVFKTGCSACHGPAEFTGDSFLGTWDASKAVDLFNLLQSTMPMDSPGSLRPQEYVDLVAYFFRANAFPAGASELAPDRDQLKLIRIDQKK